MSADLKLLSIEDLEMLLRIQCEKAGREAEVKRLAEEAERAATEAAKKAEEVVVAKAAKVKVRKAAAPKKRKATEVDSGSEPELGPSQKKGKGKVRAMSAGSMEEAKDTCLR
jgi:membrane protein involved in colicin uptake